MSPENSIIFKDSLTKHCVLCFVERSLAWSSGTASAFDVIIRQTAAQMLSIARRSVSRFRISTSLFRISLYWLKSAQVKDDNTVYTATNKFIYYTTGW